MGITNWYVNGSLDAFQVFCVQNRNRLVYIKLVCRSEFVRGILHSYRVEPLIEAGIFILLTDMVIHPAFYSINDIRSLHCFGLDGSIQPGTTNLPECHAC
jgi:hypothetical protein